MPLRKKSIPSQPRFGDTQRKILKSGAMVLGVALLFGGFVFLVKQRPELIGINPQAALPQSLGSVDNNLLIEEVGRIFQLPDEEATVATVTDPAALADQPFFAKSEAGDVALVYPNARKAILYRPSLKKVIEVGVVNTDNVPETATSPSSEAVPSLSPQPTQ